jgi:hypothetical protein
LHDPEGVVGGDPPPVETMIEHWGGSVKRSRADQSRNLGRARRTSRSNIPAKAQPHVAAVRPSPLSLVLATHTRARVLRSDA